MAFWTYQHLAALTKGRWLVEPLDLTATVTGLWHDTRDLKSGQAYLAIKGENFDGHDFVDQAFDAGAALAIVSEAPKPNPQHPAPILKVADTVQALQDLARAYRDELAKARCKVIGIAGSNGKTTTRHLIHHVLTHAGLKGIQSPKSFNNHLGVPLTLLSGKPQDDFIACEIGTNHPGEIDFLSAIARPDIAVITSIGEEHLAFFKTVRGVAEEEAAILSHILPAGYALCPKQDWDRYLRRYLDRDDLHLAHAGYAPQSDAAQAHLWSLPAYMQSNIALAGQAALLLGASIQAIDSAILSFEHPPGRAQTLRLGQVTVIHDAYNANPSSVRESFAWFANVQRGRRIMIFGDMLELGDRAVEAHQRVGMQADTHQIDLMITIGQLAAHAALSAESTPVERHDRWSDDLPDRIAAGLEPGDTVLLKASRGMRLERLIPAIQRRFGDAVSDKPT